MLYKLPEEELYLDARPKVVLFNQHSNQFYVNPPIHDEGLAQTNQEAGLKIDKAKRELHMTKITDGLVIKKQTLREKIINVKDHTKKFKMRKDDYLTDLRRK